MTKPTNLTATGQVTIPQDVRDALGLKPGDAVEVTLDGEGGAVIRRSPGPSDDGYAARYAAAMAQIEAAREKYKHLHDGRSTEEIMRELRGDEAMR